MIKKKKRKKKDILIANISNGAVFPSAWSSHPSLPLDHNKRQSAIAITLIIFANPLTKPLT
jgi:hypothetical protein